MADSMPDIIFSMLGVGKVFRTTNKQVLENIYLSFFHGAKIGVLGLNGSGKSTLLRIIAGLDDDYLGKIDQKKGVTFGYLPQEPELDPSKSVMEIVSEGAQEAVSLIQKYNAVSEQFADPNADFDKLMEEQAKLQEKIDHLNAWDIESKLEMAMDALRCPPGDTDVTILSGGERRRVALCRLLLQEPDVLLLDEPTNHLDAESVAWLEQHLARYEGTVIAVTHDRYFLDNVAGWILELDRGKGIPFEGNYTSWLEQKQQRLAIEEKQESKRQKALQHELEWVRMSPKGRHTKSKARIASYEEMLERQTEARNEEVEIPIMPGPRLGKDVIIARNVSKGYGDRLLFENLNFSLPPGGIVGIIGANGAGKTTLFRMIMGEEQPDGGEIRIGQTAKLGYVDQGRELNPTKSVFDIISGGADFLKIGRRDVHYRSYVGSFNFKGPDQQKKASELSGGERNRVHLASMLKEGANVLLLDEPTNDLDVSTLRALEEAILNFAGCAVVISHDRWFLDRIATHILAFEGDSSVYWFDGNYSEYEENRQKRLGEVANRPHRLTYR
ncbi:MAG: energy-dependent translational throttle protein EttA, partial [Rhodothermia bacterium]